MGDKNMKPGPCITLENVSCDWEQRNGVIAGLREKLVLVFVF